MKIMSLSQDPERLLVSLVASSVYLHTACFGLTSGVLGVAWSLEIEVQFYILMPLLALVFLIRANWARRGILIAAMLTIIFFQPITLRPLLEGLQWQQHVSEIITVDTFIQGAGWQRHIINYLQFFLAGILLADVYVVSWNSKPAGQRWGDTVWLIGWPALFWTLLHQEYLAARLAFPLL